jgi:serine-type D-Ala-D-Ala endopeptidase (penicillin-binding protein 7)
MTLFEFAAILGAIAMKANPNSNAIPVRIDAAKTVIVPTPPSAPKKVRTDSFGVKTTAPSAIIVDMGSGSVLYSKQSTVQRSIASMTKLVSAMVILDNGYLKGDPITIAPEDIESIGSHDFNAGDVISRPDAFKAFLSGSLNEIGNAFARVSPGGRSAFVAAMNAKAKALGLEEAEFADPTGIDAQSKASALDVARILRSATAYPEIREATESGAFSLKTANGHLVKVKPTNLLLDSYLNKDPYKVIAGKTGSLPEAGFCLGQVTRNSSGNQIIAVVLGSGTHFDRFQDVKALTAWAFDAYRWE